MPTTSLMPLPKLHFTTAIGTPLVGGKVYTYAAGTTNPKTTYTDAAGTTPHENPIPLNLRGEPPSAIYWSGNYRVDVRDALGNLVYSVDNYNTDPAGLWDTFTRLLASSGSSLIGFIQAGAGAIKQTLQDLLRERVSVTQFGAVGLDGSDDTAGIQKTLNYLATLGSGIATSPGGRNYKLTAAIDFSVLGNQHKQYTIDFGGSTITWDGVVPAGQEDTFAMLKFFNNKSVTLKNFTLQCTPDVDGIKVDSAQPDGSDQLVFKNFNIKNYRKAFALGSTSVTGQNRVSDLVIKRGVIELGNTGIYTNSTNVDSLIITNVILSGNEKHVHLHRAGFVKLDTVTGYGYQANGGINAFVYRDGPTGPIILDNCQQENGGYAPAHFFRQNDYTLARQGATTMISCTVDDDILLEAGAGSDAYILNIEGGRIGNLTVNNNDTNVNLIGTELDAGKTLTMNAINTKLFNHGSKLYGTVVDNSKGGTLLASNGYRNTPDGIVEQWGGTDLFNVPAGGVRAEIITFPKPFNQIYSINPTLFTPGDGNVSMHRDPFGTTLNSFKVVFRNNDTGAAQDMGVCWTATGV